MRQLIGHFEVLGLEHHDFFIDFRLSQPFHHFKDVLTLTSEEASLLKGLNNLVFVNKCSLNVLVITLDENVLYFNRDHKGLFTTLGGGYQLLRYGEGLFTGWGIFREVDIVLSLHFQVFLSEPFLGDHDLLNHFKN